ncbi:hypothetical protein SKAU_G00384720 [Synaphobranchus kaupii]|uniref:Uncharacterized protein n=1 Tax=Synaphobranchus kaupii TaxID=118154 RepID=A0A9Q1EEB5_SYNKA|nr:hypothetical protein SKAU_G00384720 [Synaphobranchus kaupii]
MPALLPARPLQGTSCPLDDLADLLSLVAEAYPKRARDEDLGSCLGYMRTHRKRSSLSRVAAGARAPPCPGETPEAVAVQRGTPTVQRGSLPVPVAASPSEDPSPPPVATIPSAGPSAPLVQQALQRIPCRLLQQALQGLFGCHPVPGPTRGHSSAALSRGPAGSRRSATLFKGAARTRSPAVLSKGPAGDCSPAALHKGSLTACCSKRAPFLKPLQVTSMGLP